MGDLTKETIDCTIKYIQDIRNDLENIENHAVKIRANSTFGNEYIDEIKHSIEKIIELKTNVFATFFAITPVIRDHKDQLDFLDQKNINDLFEIVYKAFIDRYKFLGGGTKNEIPDADNFMTREEFFKDFKIYILENIKKNGKYIVKTLNNKIRKTIG